MTNINLTQIGELAMEAKTLELLAISRCFNTEGEKTKVNDAQLVTLIKTYQQAKNLHTKLVELHRVCTDFAAGNFQPYIDEHEKWVENDGVAFDPFNELRICFDMSSVYDLPAQIEQYYELTVLANAFVGIQKAQQEGMKKFFGNVPRHYRTVDDEGETVMIPEGEMPEGFFNERDANEAINAIEIEYSLDGYNEFYKLATSLIQLHKGGDIRRCAEAILTLFKSSK